MENNNLENNNVTPVAPVMPEQPVQPAAPEVPVQPVEPVAPVAPVQPTEPVAPVAPVESAPVAPIAPQQPAPVQPVAPQGAAQPPLAPIQPNNSNGGNKVFIILVIVLILAIVGVVIAFVVQAKNNAGVSGGDNTTTTTTTTAEKTTIGTITNTTSTAVITTRANTTTVTRTTRSADTPAPVSVTGEVIKVGSYNLPLASGYKLVQQNGVTSIVNTTKKVQIVFSYISGYTTATVDSSLDDIIAKAQSQGFEVTDAVRYHENGKAYYSVELSSTKIPTGYKYYLVYADLGTGLLESYVLTTSTTDIKTAIVDIINMIESAKSSSTFAPGNTDELTEVGIDGVDNLDTRVFE